jgi:uncharacterized integral membrane protein (TIGR00697 family)
MSTELFHNPDSTRKFTWIAMLFVVALIASNLMACKLVVLGSLLLPASVILFPFCIILGNVLAEVWGVGKARQVILMGFVGNAILVVFMIAATSMPYNTELWLAETHFQMVYHAVPRILLASFIAYLVGEICNTFALKLIKKTVWSHHFFVRAIGSTVIGQIFDTAIFVLIAFGEMRVDLLQMILAYYGVKVLIATLVGTPLAYVAVNWARN